MTAAFFDIDHTLLKGAAGTYLIRYLYEKKYIGIGKVLKTLYYSMLYRLNWIDPFRLYRWGYEICNGFTLDDIKHILDETYDRYISRRFFKEGIEKVKEHQQRGDIGVLISGAPDYYVAKIAQALGLSHFIATESPIEGGTLTSNLEGKTLCYGRGKVILAEKFAQETGVNLKTSYFYTDSASDIPLLRKVGYPVAVNPQRLLRREAERHGWPILRFNPFQLCTV